jgi:phenylacetaldehyde dehydrogenase
MNIAIAKPKLGKDSKAFLAQKHRMLIGGKWVEAKSGKTFEVEDPATQEVIAHVPAGDKADIDAAVAAARKAFEGGVVAHLARRARQARVADRRPPRTARRRIRRA